MIGDIGTPPIRVPHVIIGSALDERVPYSRARALQDGMSGDLSRAWGTTDSASVEQLVVAQGFETGMGLVGGWEQLFPLFGIASAATPGPVPFRFWIPKVDLPVAVG